MFSKLAWAGVFSCVLTQHAAAQSVVRVAQPQPLIDGEYTEPSPSDVVIPEVAPLAPAEKDLAVPKPHTGSGAPAPGCADGYGTGLLSESGVNLGGWTQVGYHNKDSFADGFHQRAGRVSLHQQWLYAERVADGTYGPDWGFRFDAMYGIDAENTQAFGNPGARWDNADAFRRGAYGWAFPQAYAELAVGDLSIIGGHFYTLIGYEVVPAPDNFFYSHAYTMNNSEPFTHTGAVATYQASEQLTLYGGWTLGWDTGFDQWGRGSNFLGGFSYALTDDAEFTYMTTVGDFGWIGRDGYMHSIVLELDLTERLKYVFHSDLLHVDQPTGLGFANSFGINQYLFYTLNDCWAAGTRIEWYKPEGISHNQATFGLNYRPHTNIVVRPEIRHEWIPAFDQDQTVFGMDLVVTY